MCPAVDIVGDRTALHLVRTNVAVVYTCSMALSEGNSVELSPFAFGLGVDEPCASSLV